MRKIKNFQDRHLDGAYYCSNCDSYSLCKMGIANRRDYQNNLKEVCTKCGRFLLKISLSYSEGQNERPFTDDSLIVVRKPNGNKFNIIRTLKASFFDDIADALLYVLTEIGSGYFNLVDYNPVTNSYKSIYTGFLEQNKICLKNVPEEKIAPFVIKRE